MNFKELFEKADISLSDEQIEKFRVYCDFLIEYNEKVNLTAVTEPEQIVNMHFIDSLKGASLKEIKQGALCADVGTGAGFPGVPIAIVRPDITVALIDSLQKRLVFLDELKEKLNLTNVYTLHGRCEDIGRGELRQKFDCVFSRAVARLNVLAEYDVPLVKKEGYMLAWKGPQYEDEIKEAENAFKVLGVRMENVYLSKMEDMEHVIVSVKKISNTQQKYPRQAGMPKKKPL